MSRLFDGRHDGTEAWRAAVGAESLCIRAMQELAPIAMSLTVKCPISEDEERYLKSTLPDRMEAAARALRSADYETRMDRPIHGL